MGGFGSLYLSTRYPELFAAAGSMSGAVDPDMTNWKLDKDRLALLSQKYTALLGPYDADTYSKYSIVNMVAQIKKNGLPLVLDIGVDDFLLEPNRELHRRLVFNHTPHDYTERPGAHTWEFWQTALSSHLLFFSNILKSNNTFIR